MSNQDEVPRMSISPEQMNHLEQKVEANPVLQNAKRLMEDADLLYHLGRYASVVALAVLSLEEIGKYLLATWSHDDPEFSYGRGMMHKKKQGAIASLYMAGSARELCKTRGINFSDLGTPEKMRELALTIMEGLEQENQFATAVNGRGIETVKWSGMYYDEDLAAKGIEPAKITKDNARELMEHCSKALMRLSDDGHVAIAKVVFQLMLDQKAFSS